MLARDIMPSKKDKKKNKLVENKTRLINKETLFVSMKRWY